MSLEQYHDLSKKNINKLIYNFGTIKTPFTRSKLTYADYTASGLPSPFVESYLQTKIYPYYSNTHSNAHNGMYMKQLIEDVKTLMRTEMNLSSEYQILFTGCGATGAANHLVNSIDYDKYKNVYIYLSLYEHYSNYLPWAELSKQKNNIELKIIPFVSNTNGSGIINIGWLEESINDIYVKNSKNTKNTLIICSISACSNINGMINPLNEIRQTLNKFSNNKIDKLFFADFAASAPYVKIDGSILDAFFFSPHKFIGSQSTPGVLIGKKNLFTKQKPFCTGGGCVIKASSKQIIYNPDIETKESAGTPNILGIIRFGKALEVKKAFENVIKTNEHILSDYIKFKIMYFSQKYANFKSILYNDNIDHLPIFSFHLTNLHYNMIVVLLNDLFGIQTRGGIGCCGLLAEHIENKYKYKGWCRVTFHWIMNKKVIENIFNAIEFVIKNGHKYVKYYDYDKSDNVFIFKKK